MAIKTKAQLQADTAALPAPITRTALITVLDDMIDSYENIIQEKTTVQRDALTPTTGDKIFNTTNARMEIYNGTTWIACSQKQVVAVDCSANPNYAEGSVGDQYIVSVAGKIGGASGKDVYVGDLVYCIVKNAGGTEASVGTSWQVCYSQGITDIQTFYAEISLTSAQIKLLNTTPQTLVAAPGAGKIIIPVDIIVNYTHVTTAYNAQTIGARYAASASAISNITASLDTYTASQIAITSPRTVTASLWQSNSILQVYASADPTTGDGTMTVGIYYKIHTL